ncbi:hypothetical protein ElyMa_001153400 [Elysia marginata]|uniref:CUB domain-containing protein n=1 Tax=Elysia marginata TaxID=1093978 RepID=A0AAV4I1T9_9GAST|nr:hypothetical protein ElyMa_001153400 [Elysia marginata]
MLLVVAHQQGGYRYPRSPRFDPQSRQKFASLYPASFFRQTPRKFDKNRFHFSSGDEVAVSDVTSDFSSIFCDSYEVKLWERGEVYLLPGTAKVNKSLDGHVETISMFQVPGLAYRELSLYLLDQSEMSLAACRQNGSKDLPAEIILIKGKANLRSWREDKTCSSCVEKRMPIPVDGPCTTEEESDSYNFIDELEKDAAHKLVQADAEVTSRKRKMNDEESYTHFARSAFQRLSDGSKSTASPSASLNLETKAHETFRENASRSQSSPNVFFSPQRGVLNYTVSSNDRYYIVIFYGTPSGQDSLFTEPGIKLQGKVSRTSFQVKDAKQVCVVDGGSPEPNRSLDETYPSSYNNSFCRFNLPWRSAMDIVVHFDNFRLGKSGERFEYFADNLSGNIDPEIDGGSEGVLLRSLEHAGMITKCQVRLSIWICLFGALPAVAVSIISSVIGFLLCRRRSPQFTARWRKVHRSHRKKKHRSTKDGLVDAEVLPEGAEGSMAIQGY